MELLDAKENTLLSQLTLGASWMLSPVAIGGRYLSIVTGKYPVFLAFTTSRRSATSVYQTKDVAEIASKISNRKFFKRTVCFRFVLMNFITNMPERVTENDFLCGQSAFLTDEFSRFA